MRCTSYPLKEDSQFRGQPQILSTCKLRAGSHNRLFASKFHSLSHQTTEFARESAGYSKKSGTPPEFTRDSECSTVHPLTWNGESIGFVSISMQLETLLPLAVDEPEMELGRKEGSVQRLQAGRRGVTATTFRRIRAIRARGFTTERQK